MSMLAPWFLMGALGIGLPVLFHLIRRRPKGEVEFSSLMFLQPTPPRLTRRSRLENLPLLLLRALALLLLAAAFARPFFRSTVLSDGADSGRRMVLLVDTSASMQRAGLWQQAIERADTIIDDLDSGDQLAIVTFDREPHTLLSFEQSAELTTEQLQRTAKSTLSAAAPTWYATNMGRAVSHAADLAMTYESDDAAENDQPATAKKSRPAYMILISDMQQGSNIESLQVYSWPKGLQLDVRRVVAEKKTNASAHVLSDASQFDSVAAESEKDRVRVRVTNSADAESSRFRIAWEGNDSPSIELPVQVPPGETRVVRMPIPDPGITSLVLRDDAHSFDNRRYLVSPQPESLTLLFVGSDASANSRVAESRDSLLFYLQRVPLNNVRRDVTVKPIEPDKLVAVPNVKTTPLIVVGEPVSTDVAERLKQYVAAGGKLLFVMTQASDANFKPAIETVSGAAALEITEAKIDDYVMLSQIDFRHPIFEPMSDPQFNDFTKVRFWSHRKIANLPESWDVVAEFDDGDPAIIEHRSGDGRIWLLTAGWEPKSSQLALSTKFLPLVYSLFDTLGDDADSYGSNVLGEPVHFDHSPTAKITGPDSMQFEFNTAEDVDRIDRPGIYQFIDADQTRSFAVNLAESESHTTPLDDDAFQRFGIKTGQTLTVAQTQAVQRQLRDIELEKNQKVWQWLLAIALGLLAIETVWGGLLSRPRTEPTPT